MGNSLTLAGSEGRITIEVTDYERPSAGNADDANWLTSRLVLQVGPFSASFKLSLTTYELATVLGDLRKHLDSLSGTVTFKSLEEDLSLTFEFATRGAVFISTVVQPHQWRGTVLRFQLSSDQTGVAQVVHQLEAILSRFPIRTGRSTE